MIADWIVPPAWRGPVSDFRYKVTRPQFAALLKRNRELYRKYADRKRCFVIGNGPSLKTQDIRPLKDEVTIVANSFFKHPDHALVSPTYCCVADTEHISGLPNSIGWLREIESKLPKTDLCFLPQAKGLFEEHGLFRHHNVYYMDTSHAATSADHLQIDLTRRLRVGKSTGTAFAIPLAIYLGCPEIYLIGFDANWLADLDNCNLHFYETNEYFPQFDKTQTPGQTVEHELACCHLDFKSHRLLRDSAKRVGIKIINATNGGWLDMYPRVHYESLFETRQTQ